ncbi:DsbA family oxidoreductase [Vibrio sp. 10N.261.51.F12]|uniref:DsbA family oxidoreductase n=1 Tax=Vibrio sp. 10N.261.51.F12 TaxID=3229679 RepID=UPI003550A523
MTDKIKLDIISDVVCPWCIVGYLHLQAAIDELGLQNRIEIEWQPFELNPDMPPEGEELREHVARKYGSSKEESDRAREQISQAGAKYGFEFRYFDGMKIVNTLDAHVLLEYAHTVGKKTELKLRLFSAFFTEQKDVSDPRVLIEEAVAVGLPKLEVEQQLSERHLKDKIRQQESQWHQMGVSSVPTVVFNRTSALTGAHPQDTYKQVLLELVSEVDGIV